MAANYLKKGFSLIELLMVVSVLSILSFVAISSLNNTLDKLALDSRINKMSNTINLAKLAVIESGDTSIICRLEHLKCVLESESGKKNWSGGWLLFSDINEDKQFDERVDKLIIIEALNASRCHIESNRGDLLSFYRLELLQGVSAASIEFQCDDARSKMVINWLGRVRFES